MKWEMKDTVDAMLSNDPEENLIAEWVQAKIRFENIRRKILKSETFDDKDADFFMLKDKLHYMAGYIVSLEKEALKKGIDLYQYDI